MNKMFQGESLRKMKGRVYFHPPAGRSYFVPLCLILLASSLLAQGSMEKFTLKKMDGEQIQWKLEADSAEFLEHRKVLKGINVNFYSKKRDPFSIEAEQGHVEGSENEEIYLEGNVRLKGYLNAAENLAAQHL